MPCSRASAINARTGNCWPFAGATCDNSSSGQALAHNIHMRAREFAAHEGTQLFIGVAHGLLEGGLHGRHGGAG